MRKKLLFLLIVLLASASSRAAVGDTFTVNKLKYKVTGESPKTAELTGYSTQPKGTLAIPESVKGYAVTGIGNEALRGCSGLTSVIIQDGMKQIGSGAFSYCLKLASVNIPDGVTAIESNAFIYCASLTSVNLPDGVTTIGDYAFCYCSKMSSINIPEGVTSIGEYAFSGCGKLEEMNIPGSVRSIGNNAFESCKALKTVNIYAPALTSYGEDAFKNAYSGMEINVFSDNVAAFQKGWADYSSKISAFSAEELTVTGVTANQNPSETSEYWVTYYHPAANTKITSDDAEIYIATLAEENGYVNLTQVEGNIIKAGQAVMLKAASADALAMELTPDAATGNYSGNDLKGGSTVATDKVAYTLAAKNGRMGFYKFTGSALNPGKAHLELPSLSASVHEFIALDEEEATGVELVQEFKSLRVQDDAWYTLDGKKMVNGKWVNGKLPQGIYIHNGRKEVVR